MLALFATILLAVVTYFLILPYAYYCKYEPQEGDIIFQSLPKISARIRTIEGVTESPYSHCGVVIKKNGKWYVNEALGSVHSTSLFTYIQRGRRGMFAIYRLKEEHKKNIPKFINALEKYQHRSYDFKYRLDDQYIYCSELVYKAYKDATNEELGKLMRLGDMNWKPYEERIIGFEAGELPLDRKMITPKHLSEANQLEIVYKFGY